MTPIVLRKRQGSQQLTAKRVTRLLGVRPKRPKQIGALIGALATGLHDEKKPVFLIVYHIHYMNAIIDSAYKYFKLQSIYEDMGDWRKEHIERGGK